MRTYRVTLTGESPLLMHNDNLQWQGEMKRWETDPTNRAASIAGDDRTPSFRWLGYCYHDGGRLGIPSDNLMTTLREGGAKTPTGKKGGTYKRQSQSGLVVNEIIWPIITPKGDIPWSKLATLMDNADYAAHEDIARELGFELFAKRAKVGQSKHVRVRPRFNAWTASGTITVTDEAITQQVLETILQMAGTYCGLGDWRPSSPKSPGPWGRFRSEIKEV